MWGRRGGRPPKHAPGAAAPTPGAWQGLLLARARMLVVRDASNLAVAALAGHMRRSCACQVGRGRRPRRALQPAPASSGSRVAASGEPSTWWCVQPGRGSTCRRRWPGGSGRLQARCPARRDGGRALDRQQWRSRPASPSSGGHGRRAGCRRAWRPAARWQGGHRSLGRHGGPPAPRQHVQGRRRGRATGGGGGCRPQLGGRAAQLSDSADSPRLHPSSRNVSPELLPPPRCLPRCAAAAAPCPPDAAAAPPLPGIASRPCCAG